MITFTNLDDI